MNAARLLLGLILVACVISACERPSQVVQPAPAESEPQQGLAITDYPTGSLSGEQLFFVCQGCHAIQADAPNKVGPNLYGLRGRQAGVYSGFVYSDALRTAGESWLVWEKGTLMGFIVDSEAMVPNTWMLFHSTLTMPETERLADYILLQGPVTSE